MSRKKVLRFFLSVLVLGILALVLAEGVVYLSGQMVRSPLKGLENQIVDLSFQTRLRNKSFDKISPDDIVIVDIDDESIELLGRPQLWPRAYDAYIISYISSGIPKAIGIDFLYTEPDTLSSVYADILEMRGYFDTKEILNALSTDPELSMSIENAGNVYLSLFDDDFKEHEPIDAEQLKFLRSFSTDTLQDIEVNMLNHPVLPILDFAAYARGIGAIDMSTEQDGTVRNYKIVHEINEGKKEQTFIGNFTLYMACDALGVQENELKFEDNNLLLGNQGKIPLLPDASFRINWLGIEDEIRYIPYHKVLSGRTPAEFFENKFVFLGTSASGMQDLKTIPSSTMPTPGVEVHAVAFLNLINQAFIKEIDELAALPLFILLSFLFIGLFLLVRPFFGFVAVVLFVFGEMFLFIIWYLPAKQAVFPIVTLMLITIFTYLISTLYIHFIRERRTRRLKLAFASYLSPDVVNKIAKESSSLNMGGEKKELSVLFSDIRDFTSYSERFDPQEIVAVLNDYLSEMSECIFRQKGTIDKFMGDAVMAIFGAPIAQANHADRACLVAIDMIRVLDDFNSRNKLKGHEPISIGIGINTGEMTVGNIGSQRRFDYTVIGDEVNLGSRLEGLTKYFGVRIIISESVLKSWKNPAYLTRFLANVAVKGKDKAVKIYELIGLMGDNSAEMQGLDIWRNAITAYNSGDLDSAKTHFNSFLRLHPLDRPAQLYLERCEEGNVHEVWQMDRK